MLACLKSDGAKESAATSHIQAALPSNDWR